MTKDINLKFRITATVITIISIIIAYVILNLQQIFLNKALMMHMFRLI